MSRFIVGQFTGMFERIIRMENAGGQKDADSPIPESDLLGYIFPMLVWAQGQCETIQFEKGKWQLETVKLNRKVDVLIWRQEMKYQESAIY